MTTLRRRVIRFFISLKIPWLRRRVGRLVLERIDDVPLVVLPEVFNPVVFRTTVFFARVLAALPDLKCVRQMSHGREPSALDLGTGSGALAIFTARRGYGVVAVDINPEAVRCARINAMLNGLERRIDVVEGDLFGPIPGERFDLITFNPPFYRGKPKNALDAAWRGADVFERFAAALPAHLKPEGRALVLLSTDGDAEGMLNALRANRLVVTPFSERDYGNEVMTIYQVSLPK